MPDAQIQEIQGLYGPFTLTERVVQKIWLRRDFAAAGLKTASGKALTVKDPGRWNLLEGPDFKEARLLIDGVECQGDVEIHFNVSDWFAHQHQGNPGFNRVVLHVVLHPDPREGVAARTESGGEPEVLFLMPYLERDLEAYVMDEALLELERQDELEWVAEFIEKPESERLRIVSERAGERWRQKLAFAEFRLSGGDWTSVCHQFALEVLGYARNRAPMSRLALKYSLEAFASGELNAEELFAEERAAWRLNGLRPANHPRRRLATYLEVVRRQPQWPQLLESIFREFPEPPSGLETAAFRKAVDLAVLRKRVDEKVFGGLIGEKRLNTLVCDALLPLAVAAGKLRHPEYWDHWPAGDAPDALRRFLKHARITDRKRPSSNGCTQGALALFLARGESA